MLQKNNHSVVAFVVCFFSFSALADNCPPSETWAIWQQDLVETLASNDYDERVARELGNRLQACRAKLPADAKALECTTHLTDFTKALSRELKPGHTLGLEVSDVDYYAKVPFSEMLELPPTLSTQDFLSLMEDDRNPVAMEEALKVVDGVNQKISDPTKKWTAFIYESQHLPTPDRKGLGRFFVHVPGDDFEQFLQFGMKVTDTGPRTTGLSMVTIQKRNPETKQILDRPVARIKDFWRIKNINGTIELSTRLIATGALENCQSCHKTPLIPIIPRSDNFDRVRFGAALTSVNSKMRSFGNAKYFGLDEEHFGPPAGPAESKDRTDDFIKKCSSNTVTDPERIAVLKEAMSCYQCHDGVTRGILNHPSPVLVLPYAQKTMISLWVEKHRKMPLGYEEELSDAERASLVSCLKSEYYGDNLRSGLLKKWLHQDGCWVK